LCTLKRVKVSGLKCIYCIDHLLPRMEKTFWEKIGFKDKKKDDQNLRDAKEKVDRVYQTLRDTMQ
jgi:hypothetical protein